MKRKPKLNPKKPLFTKIIRSGSVSTMRDFNFLNAFSTDETFSEYSDADSKKIDSLALHKYQSNMRVFL